MAKNLLNKYVWLVDTIYRAGKITYEEISRRWLDNDLSEGKPLPIRTLLVAGTVLGYDGSYDSGTSYPRLLVALEASSPCIVITLQITWC